MKPKKSSQSHSKRARLLHPKLRLMCNGNAEVNKARAAQCACLVPAKPMLAQEAPPAKARAPRPAKKRPKIKNVTSEVLVNVFVEFDPGHHPSATLDGQTARLGDIATLQIPLSKLERVLKTREVMYVSQGESLRRPLTTDFSADAAASHEHSGNVKAALADTLALHRNGILENGKRVLIGLIDVGGFDFSHPDFLESPTKTRFHSIWDQGGDLHDPPEGYSYGSELQAVHMNAALRSASSAGVTALDLEPQSQMEPGSHATHVASIAAGNGGICPEAIIAGVLIDLPPEDSDRRQSFYDSTRIAHAVEYLLGIASAEGVPISINISLGTNGHAHDASSATSRWIDSALASSGRSVCVAAGNAGQEGPAEPGDTGFIMGRIHTAGIIPAKDLDHDISWLVVGDGVEDVSENELEIWYQPQDRFAVSIRPPGGDWIGPIEPRQFLENHVLDGGSLVSVYSELYHPANGSNYISIYLSPKLDVLTLADIVGVPSGIWTVRLHGLEIRDGRFDGWIERDDPRRIGSTDLWRFPSFFAGASNVDDSSVSSLACGHRVVSVANLDEDNAEINISSSQGPTRDDRPKPDTAAPGTGIIAANGFSDPSRPWTAKTGTSMASPFTAGVIGLMLAAQPGLTAAQIGGIIKRTCNPLPNGDFEWDDSAGFGAIDLRNCVKQAAEALNDQEVAP